MKYTMLIVAALGATLLTPAPAHGQVAPGRPVAEWERALVGEIRAFAISESNGTALNRLYRGGWMPADGRTLPRSGYRELFAVLGTTWGVAADDASFVIPDLRGAFLRGYNGGGGRDPDAAARVASANGGASGNSVGSYQADAMQSHRHLDSGHRHGLDQRDYTGRNYGAGPYDQARDGAPLSSAIGRAEIGDPAESSAGPPRLSTESRPGNVAVYYFIFTGRRAAALTQR